MTDSSKRILELCEWLHFKCRLPAFFSLLELTGGTASSTINAELLVMSSFDVTAVVSEYTSWEYIG
jgi:hypothetical protein